MIRKRSYLKIMNQCINSGQTRLSFSLYKSFSNYFQILIFILVDRNVCWEHLGIICFCYGLVLLRIFWNKKRKNVENTDVLIFFIRIKELSSYISYFTNCLTWPDSMFQSMYLLLISSMHLWK